MKVLYYTQTHFLDTALPRIKALSGIVDLDVILEIAPNTWRSGIFDVARRDLREGLHSVDELFASQLVKFRSFWACTRSFTVVVHNCNRSIHPKSWVTSRRARRLVTSCRPDVIHFDDVSMRAAWVLLGRKLAPMVLSVHDPLPHDGKLDWRDGLARRIIAPKTDKFIVHNGHQRDVLANVLNVNKDAVDVVPLGILDIFKTACPAKRSSDRKTILFFGRLARYKGLGILYDAMTEVAERLPGVRLIVAGRPLPGYSMPAPPTLPNGGSIEVLERYIDNDTLADLFNTTDVVACPYLDATQSGVVLTAYAFGKPVVATRVGGLPEYVSNGLTGYLVDPGDANQLAAKVVDTLNSDPSVFRKNIETLGRGALSWGAIARQTKKVYEAALADGAS